MLLQINLILILIIQSCYGIEISENPATGNDFCELPLPKLSFFPPLIFTEDGTLKTTQTIEPDDVSIVRVNVDEQIILSCSPNFFTNYPTKTKIIGTCKRDSILGTIKTRYDMIKKM